MPDQSFGQFPALKAIDNGDGTYSVATSMVRAVKPTTVCKRKSKLPFVSESLRRKAAQQRHQSGRKGETG